MNRALEAILAAILVGTISMPAVAQQRPLVTEDPETIGAGRMLVEAGFDYARDVEYPASGLQGHLRRFPLIGISMGIGSIGEVQLDGGLYNHLTITGRRTAPLRQACWYPRIPTGPGRRWCAPWAACT